MGVGGVQRTIRCSWWSCRSEHSNRWCSSSAFGCSDSDVRDSFCDCFFCSGLDSGDSSAFDSPSAGWSSDDSEANEWKRSRIFGGEW